MHCKGFGNTLTKCHDVAPVFQRFGHMSDSCQQLLKISDYATQKEGVAKGIRWLTYSGERKQALIMSSRLH
jgi:hypothetical protein